MKLLLAPAILLRATSSSAFTTAPTHLAISRSNYGFERGNIISKTQVKMSSTTEGSIDVSSYMSGTPPEGTEDFIMQQTMFRVKDPKKSLDFYCNVLGFKLIHHFEVSINQRDRQ